MSQNLIQPASQQTDEDDNYKKGYEFENYVQQLFNKNHFTLMQWRKAHKYLHKDVPVGHSNPDLELIFGRRNKHRFAVECKWRSQFTNGMIHWAHEHQIRSYLDFQAKERVPVFIAIGVGGEPSSPDKLFVTPLDNIYMYTDVYERRLIPFNRVPTQRFFYDTVQLQLF